MITANNRVFDQQRSESTSSIESNNESVGFGFQISSTMTHEEQSHAAIRIILRISPILERILFW